MPKSLPAEGASVLIAAISGRALAAAARRAGLTPLVADFFADADTGRMAHSCRKFDSPLKHGMRWASLDPALEALAREAPSPVLGLIYGSGFEDRVELLAKLAERWPLLGNGPREVERVKAPESFFAELASLGVSHPRTVIDPPLAGKGWLTKRRGGAGGSHVAVAGQPQTPTLSDRSYFQEEVEGRPVSALFVGDGARARVLGFSQQWTAPTRASSWRYGGAVRPAELSSELELRMTEAVERVACAFQLKGLGSADFLVGEGRDGAAFLLEINPRPGATLDIFDSDDEPLLGLHLDAVLSHRLPEGPLRLQGASSAAIVYASEPFMVSAEMIWPDWAADQPGCGDWIDKNRPICTVLARAETGVTARRLVEDRIGMILAECGGNQGGTQ
ncbi:MAG: ATP-grasp domain-containing protein [Methyloceanibacter sp.]